MQILTKKIDNKNAISVLTYRVYLHTIIQENKDPSGVHLNGCFKCGLLKERTRAAQEEIENGQ